MTHLDDRRSQPRAELVAPAVVLLGNERFECRVIDVSTDGIALWSPRVRPPGLFVRVEFPLALPGGIPRWCEAGGVIARAEGTSDGAVLGVRLLVVDDGFIRDVQAHVLRSATRPVLPDALHPPPTTGEFSPSEPDVRVDAPRRRTAQ